MSGIIVSGLRIFCRILALAAPLSAAAFGSNAASAQEATVLDPSSPWNLDYAEDRCRLVRFLGESDDRVVLVLEQLAPSSHFQLTLAGNPFDEVDAQKPASLQMGPVFDLFERNFEVGTLGEYKPALVFEPLSPIHAKFDAGGDPEADTIVDREAAVHDTHSMDPENGEKIEWLEFHQTETKIRLRTGPLGKPFAALNACTTDLLISLGIDPEEFAKIQQPAKLTNLQRVFSEVSQFLIVGHPNGLESTTISFGIFISATGEVTDCKLLIVGKAERFSRKLCDSYARIARYDPALDADGKPVVSYKIQDIRFEVSSN